MKLNPRALRIGLAALAVMGATAAAPYWMGQRVTGANDGVTRLRVTSQVMVPGVKRMGMNLGFQDFYDAGQMTKNLIFRNPGFEGMTYRTVFHCQQGGSSSCVDRRQGVQFPSDFWDGSYLRSAGWRRGRSAEAAWFPAGAAWDGYGLGLDTKGKAHRRR